VTNQSLDTNYSTRHKRDGWVFGQAIGQNDLRHLYITQKIKLSEVIRESAPSLRTL
jgi:hypothetical protein